MNNKEVEVSLIITKLLQVRVTLKIEERSAVKTTNIERKMNS